MLYLEDCHADCSCHVYKCHRPQLRSLTNYRRRNRRGPVPSYCSRHIRSLVTFFCSRGGLRIVVPRSLLVGCRSPAVRTRVKRTSQTLTCSILSLGRLSPLLHSLPLYHLCLDLQNHTACPKLSPQTCV
ncbi:hypothetical protein K491DRAFT_420754 [Lophiostoma macrostomum CBS 122681]|uniref:Uncharacterized protein n=1 Tax=Lophiostoma macrostomum CBS 122681 TaxID=1314788 RepID=A0A6A6TSQ2_9PLEO|nr:hypothetical protein K491DRAFT_420754 [Lophiostoma macrostomum CBS 122681]